MFAGAEAGLDRGCKSSLGGNAHWLTTVLTSNWIYPTRFDFCALFLFAAHVLGVITPRSTMYGTSAANQGASPKHIAWAIPNFGLEHDPLFPEAQTAGVLRILAPQRLEMNG